MLQSFMQGTCFLHTTAIGHLLQLQTCCISCLCQLVELLPADAVNQVRVLAEGLGTAAPTAVISLPTTQALAPLVGRCRCPGVSRALA
jgi:hypothetical protein